ncbi:MAG: hypothetical protein FWD58_06980 [Firmicutes bacterium]|nr:hypothetical protein [Bacillota bacterium]
MPTKSAKPGQEAGEDIVLYVKDSKGKTMGEIKVPAGHRVPPTAKAGAASYQTKSAASVKAAPASKSSPASKSKSMGSSSTGKSTSGKAVRK